MSDPRTTPGDPTDPRPPERRRTGGSPAAMPTKQPAGHYPYVERVRRAPGPTVFEGVVGDILKRVGYDPM